MSPITSGALVALSTLNSALTPTWDTPQSPSPYAQQVKVHGNELTVTTVSAPISLKSPVSFDITAGVDIRFNVDLSQMLSADGSTVRLQVFLEAYQSFSDTLIGITLADAGSGLISHGLPSTTPWFRIVFDSSGVPTTYWSADGETWTPESGNFSIPTNLGAGISAHLILGFQGTAPISVKKVIVTRLTDSRVLFEDDFHGNEPDITKWLPPTPALHMSLGSYTSPASAPYVMYVDCSASTGITSPFDYKVDFGDGTVIGLQASPLFTHTYTADGIYSLVGTLVDSVGAVVSLTSIINIAG